MATKPKKKKQPAKEKKTKAEKKAPAAPEKPEPQPTETPVQTGNVPHVPIGDESDLLTKHIIEVAGTIEDDDDARRNYVASTRFIASELVLEMAKAWPEIRDVARKTSKDGEHAATASVAIGVKIDLTNLHIMTVDLKFAVAPYRHQHAASATEDLRQLKMDFLGGTVTRVDESGPEETPEPVSEKPQEPGEQGPPPPQGPPQSTRADELAKLDRDALVALARGMSIEVPDRARKQQVIELIVAHETAAP